MLYFYKKIWISSLLTLSLFLVSINLVAQQTPFQSNQAFYPQLYNPAALGTGQVAISYRQQWVDFNADVAPQSFLLFSDFSSLLPFRDKVGIGLTVQSDQTHIFNRTNANLSFAYHLFNQNEHRFSLGIIAGLLNQRLDLSDLKVSSLDEIELYNGSSTQLTFDGGPGIFYQFKNEGNKFVFNFALPQLFTSDFTFDQEINPKYENQLHFIAGIQYRKKIASFEIEPSILYRAANGKDKTLAKSTTDLNLTAFFLDNLFWVNGGVRLNGNTLMGGAGVRIAKKIDLAGIYEYHNELGTSYEMTAIYRFNAPIPPPPPLYLQQLLSEEKKLKVAEASHTSSKYSKLKKNLQYANEAFSQAKNSGNSLEELKTKLENTDKYLAIAKTEMDKILYDVQPNYQSLHSANRIFEIAQKEGGKHKSISKRHDAILDFSENINLKVLQNHQEYLNLKDKIQAYKLRKKIIPSFAETFRKGEANKIAQQLNDDLGKIPGVGNNAKVTAKVNQSKSIEINYKIPYIGNSYVLGKQLNPQKNIIKHISEQLKQIQLERIQIVEVQIEMLLQDELSEMKKTNSPFPYLGEFGPVIVKSTLHDKDNEKEEEFSVQINKWNETSITELASLKLFGARRYLKENGLRSSVPIHFRISGPNYDEDNWQTLQIKIITRP